MILLPSSVPANVISKLMFPQLTYTMWYFISKRLSISVLGYFSTIGIYEIRKIIEMKKYFLPISNNEKSVIFTNKAPRWLQDEKKKKSQLQVLFLFVCFFPNQAIQLDMIK